MTAKTAVARATAAGTSMIATSATSADSVAAAKRTTATMVRSSVAAGVSPARMRVSSAALRCAQCVLRRAQASANDTQTSTITRQKGHTMAYRDCPDCGERVYNLGCTNCNEAAYINDARPQ